MNAVALVIVEATAENDTNADAQSDLMQEQTHKYPVRGAAENRLAPSGDV